MPSPGSESLARHLTDGAVDDPMLAELTGWLAASTRFRAFADAHRDKIRKKLRGAADAEARRDVRAELRVAQLLLADGRIELAFEAYGSGRPGPDFTITYRGTQSFNLEVTRPRLAPNATALGRPLLAKLRQLPPGTPNAVLLAVGSDQAPAFDVTMAARTLRARADRKDEAFFTRRGFSGTRGFYERYLRLGAVFVASEIGAGDERATLWRNPSARIAVPARAARAALTCLRAS